MKSIIKLTIMFAFITFLSVPAYSKAFPYAGDVTGGIEGSDRNWDSYIDFIVPLAGNEKSFIFLSPRGSMTGKNALENDAGEFNLGVGYRKYTEKFFNGSIIGINAYYDTRNSDLANHFQQIGLGAELLTRHFDLRINGYFPIGDNDYFLGKVYNVFKDNHVAATYFYESAAGGFDSEIGFNLPIPEWAGELRLFGGYYYFSSDILEETYSGFKGRAEYRPLSILSLNYSVYQDDDFTGSNWRAGADIKIPFDFRTLLRGSNPFAGFINYVKSGRLPLEKRIGEKVQRDMHVRTYVGKVKRNNDIAGDEEGFPYHFTVVSPSGSGNGTFRNPARLEDGVTFNKNVTGNNAVLLLLGGEYEIASPLNLNGHQAKHIIAAGPAEMSYRGIDLSAISKGNAVLKIAPSVTAFTADDDSPGVEHFLISAIEFEGTAQSGTGLAIKNINTDFFVGNNSFSNLETGIRVENSSTSVCVYNNIISSNAAGAEIVSGAAFFEQNIISFNTNGISVNAAEDAYIYYNRIENNTAGISVSESSGTHIYVNELENNVYGISSSRSTSTVIYDNLIASSSINGIYSDLDTKLNIESNKIYGTLADGAHILNSSGSVIYDNTIVNSGNNGIFMTGGQNVLISSNSSLYNLGNGFSLNDMNILLFEQNTASCSVKNGAFFSGISAAEINDNSAFSGEESGFYFDGLSGSNVSTNKGYFNKGSGIRAEETENSSLSSNTLAFNAASGIHYLSGSNTKIEGNNVYENETGILVSGGSSVAVSSNIADDNVYGIKASGSESFTVSNNDVSGNTAAGIYVADMENANIALNYAQNNKGIGIYAYNLTSSSVTANTASYNASSGITVEKSSSTQISHNAVDHDSLGKGISLIDSSGNFLYFNLLFGTGSETLGLYLGDTITFDAESGKNIFFNSGYGGDDNAKTLYEQSVYPKDEFR